MVKIHESHGFPGIMFDAKLEREQYRVGKTRRRWESPFFLAPRGKKSAQRIQPPFFLALRVGKSVQRSLHPLGRAARRLPRLELGGRCLESIAV